MKKQTFRTCLALLALLPGAVSCGGGSRGKQAAQPPADTKAEDKADDKSAPVADDGEGAKAFSKEELMYLAGSSAATSQSAYDHCGAVLAAGVYNTYHERISDGVREAMKRQLCTLDEGTYVTKLQDSYKNRNASSSSSSDSTSVGFDYYKVVTGNFGNSNADANSQSSEMSQDQLRELGLKWRKQNCGEVATFSSQDFAHVIQSENVDPKVIDAWRSCVTQENRGFFCSSRENDGSVSVTLQWVPNDLQKKLLPRLDIELGTSHNLTPVSKEVPKKLGMGSGVSLTFTRVDPSKGGVVEFTGRDAGKQVNFTCSLGVPKVARMKRARDPRCGVESYKRARASLCGVESFKSASGSQCGVANYNLARTATCGEESYAKGHGPQCGASQEFSVKLDVGSVRINPAQDETWFRKVMNPEEKCRAAFGAPYRGNVRPTGYFTEGLRPIPGAITVIPNFGGHGTITHTASPSHEGKGWITCTYSEYPECNHRDFGITYKACRSPAHGVESYNTCRHADFGVEAYKECADASFGVETYNECLVPED